MATRDIHYDRQVGYDNHRSVAEVLTEFKEELKDFVTTRVQMLRAEMTEKTQAWKVAAPAIVIGAVMLLMSLFVFTGFLVAIIALAFGDRNWAYAASFAIVFVLYALIGAVTAMYGVRTLKASGVAPERTLRVLKQDQVWLQTEARTQQL